jgi:hypothetical protein
MGSNPAWKDGYTPNAAEWNSWWAKKADEGSSGGGGFLPLTGGDLTGPLTGTTLNFSDPSFINGITINGNNSNTIYGVSAGASFTSGNGNVAFGTNSMRLATTSTTDVCLGMNTMRNGGVISNSVAIGFAAIYGNPSANANNLIGIGSNALWGGTTLTTAANLIGIGVNAGQNIVDCADCVFIGSNAGQQLAHGGQSIMIGTFTGSGLTSGSNNVLIGYEVASSTLQTGSNDIYIGTGPAIDAATAGESGTLRIGGHATNTIRATGINTAASKLFLDWMPASTTFASDSAASAGGVAVGQLYRNGSAIQCRIV